MTDGQIIDREKFGRLARAARVIAGFDRVEDAAAAIRKTAGIEVSARTIYALERGEQDPTMPQFLAMNLTYLPPSGVWYWDSALREDVREGLDRARRGES
jgi:hypothetical protein